MEKGNDSFTNIWQALSDYKNVVMTLHPLPDGDSLGSCAAMKYALERDLDMKVRLVSYDGLAKNYQELPYASEVEWGTDISEVDLSDYDALVSLDIASYERMSAKARKDFHPGDIPVICIDHHETNKGIGTLNYIEPRYSTCSILIDLFKENNVAIDAELANRLLLGVCTDSLFFCKRNPEDAMQDALYLMKQGADYYGAVVDPIIKHVPYEIMKAEGRLIENLVLQPERKFAYTTLTKEEMQELDVNLVEAKRGMENLHNLGDADFMCILFEEGNFVKGSFRSKSEAIDVTTYASALGGGGHPYAAGFTLEGRNIEEAVSEVLAVVKQHS